MPTKTGSKSIEDVPMVQQPAKLSETGVTSAVNETTEIANQPVNDPPADPGVLVEKDGVCLYTKQMSIRLLISALLQEIRPMIHQSLSLMSSRIHPRFTTPWRFRLVSV